MKNLSPLREQFFAQGKVEDCPIYDMHGHMGPIYHIHLPVAGVDKMVLGMDRAGVKKLVFCHHSTLFSPDMGNLPGIEAVRKHPDKLRAYCGINPNYPELTQNDLHSFDQFSDVYVGFKFLADYHRFPLTSDRYKPAWEMAQKKNLLVLLHTWGGSKNNGYEQIREVAERYPEVRILMGHSLHGDWDNAIELARTFPNLYLELCAVIDERGILERFVGELGSEKILFGTDYPWFDYHYYIGAVLGACIDDEDCRNIFYRNAMKLLDGLA